MTMKKAVAALCLLLASAWPLNTQANPHVLSWASLSEDSLLGQVHSTAQLERAFVQDDTLLARAGDDIGLSRADYATVRSAVVRGRARYVTLPRHLDAMAGMHGGRTFADRDVIIPEGVHGWEVD